MFGKTLGGQSTLGIPSASTPTSTPAPAMNNQLPQKTNGLFGNATTNFGTSTPSPSGTFGSAASQNKPPNGGLFGNTAQTSSQPSNNLFGNSNTAKAPQGNTTGSLFGATAPATTTNTGLFGNSNTAGGLGSTGGLFGNTNKPPVTGGLFGSNNAAPQVGTQTGSLFGNSNTNTKPAGASLFGNSSTTNVQPTATGQLGNPTTTTTNGTLFGGKPATANLMGGQSLFGNKPQAGNGLFGNSIQGTNNVSSIPSNTVKFDMSNMPKSITPSVQKQEPSTMQTPSTRTSFSLPSKSRSEHQVLPSNIFGKLNTRLKYIKESSTKGIFSTSSKGWSHLPYNGNRIADDKTLSLNKTKDMHMNIMSINSLEGQDIKNLRVLKIDPNRSAAKKLKLLPNIAVPTQQVVQSVDNLKHVVTTQPKENNSIDNNENIELATTNVPLSRESKSSVENVENSFKDIDQIPSDYWCSPSPDELRKLSSEQLASVSNFIIGRKGYGTISFNFDVDLTSVARNIETQLFGKIVNFNSSKTVEVYPDHNTKPTVGYGLNIPATISIEGVYPIDKKTKKPHVNSQKSSEIQLLIRRLKNMKGMEFISYNPFGGIWTFRVNHFSIWGLIDSEDVEIDEADLKQEEKTEEKIQDDRMIQTRTLAQSNSSNVKQSSENDTQANLLVLQDRSFGDQDYELDNTGDNDLVEEKAYEPEVDEEDIELMEAEPSLEITDDWVEQLRIASASNNSVFVKRFSQSKIEENPMTLLFSDFNQNFETMKKIVKERRMTTNYTFAKFDSHSRLLTKNINKTSGTQFLSLKSSLNEDELIMKSSLLDLHLKSVEIEQRETNRYPTIKSHTLHFTAILPLIHQSSPDYEVWRLCSILHDEIVLPQEIKNDAVRGTLCKESRYKSLCNWVLDQIKEEVNFKIKGASDPLDMIFYFLFLNDNINASKVAISSNNAYLSVILSFLGSNDPRVAEFASNQLEAWEISGHQVEPKVRRIYEILGETFFNSKTSILKLLEDFSWLAVFGLGLFYGRIDENSLENLTLSLLEKIPHPSEDLRYVTLQLFSCEKNTEQLFKTLKYQNQQLGTQFAWYYVQILKFRDAKTFSNDYCDLLTLDLMEDLRIEELTEQALFVSCFLKNDRVASQQISDLVSRNIVTFIQNKILLERLQIPESVVYSAAAVLDKYNGNYLSQLENLLEAGSFKEAETEMMLIVGPKLVLKYNAQHNTEVLETLSTFLKKFPKDKMDNWRNTLQVYEEFVDIILKNNQNNNKTKSIEDSLKLLMRYHKHKLVPACCNIIEKKLKAMQF
ncbi:similar to Saccharomyces cerevisiae YGL092W NUP145 Essential nucleoporin, subunit of the Nup84p subcomplex [Maudiozyma saulgeensis]|uniref:Similar to Saccharomyces cerevisiae YGL092W NUP145 Essential nucleoporin, subunit of the Nup84p subcomplex n=1 Tax=Maudiozyma saulgeensis TaxID=1789683 RepID=A0A1X7R0M6_9SACH|nr:similar to Saccharomyces cerevisiae YGL092W NUP145 Essential nucleoporin, subunit of the Nup84p subcomplex [Kazachstania saulgeensis]